MPARQLGLLTARAKIHPRILQGLSSRRKMLRNANKKAMHFACPREWLHNGGRVSVTRRRVSDVRVHPVKHHPQHRDQHKQQHAAFGTDGASGEPPWAMERGIEQVSGQNQTAVRDRIEKRLAPVPGRVHSNCKPQTSSASQGEAEEEADDNYSKKPDSTFARIT